MGTRRARRAHGRVQSLPASQKRSSASVAISKPKRSQRVQQKAAILSAARDARHIQETSAPPLVALIPICGASDSDVAGLQRTLQSSSAPGARAVDSFAVRCDRRSERKVLLAALDAAKVADYLLLVFGGVESELGMTAVQVLKALREQGLPSVFAVAIGEGAEDAALRKLRGRVLAAESLGDAHALRPIHVAVGAGEKGQEVNRLALRRIFAKNPRAVSWRSRYGYLRVESAEAGVSGMSLCGWVRGRGLSANELVHLTGFGTFAVQDVVDAATGGLLSRRVEADAEDVESVGQVDGLMGEQTWPPEVEDEGDAEAEPVDEETVEEIAAKYDQGADEDSEAEVSEAMEEMDGSENQDDEDDAMSVDEEEVSRVRAAARTDALFPDEVDTPIDQPARVRYARYRGLKSLRTGEWDPKEQLPRDYAALFQFRNLAATRKRVLDAARKEGEAAVAGKVSNFAGPGQRVCVRLLNVPPSTQNEIMASLRTMERPVVASGMLRHENRRSVVHFGLQRVDDEEDAVDIKAKAHLELHCGFVRFSGRPMFSEHNANSDKHKMERFLRHGRYTVASFYGPAIYAPAPALLCQVGGPLIATGTALGADPDRIMLKRIILTGYPFKTQKRKTVAKFMFFNPEDVRWFKPVELWSKMGRSGHILEPVGTHGHMKCIFDSVILHHDTVCMTLYKRVYPKLLADEDPAKQSM